jgi:hypothetical protein
MVMQRRRGRRTETIYTELLGSYEEHISVLRLAANLIIIIINNMDGSQGKSY